MHLKLKPQCLLVKCVLERFGRCECQVPSHGHRVVVPVEGLRASRSGLSFTLNLPKPGSDVSFALLAALVISANTASTLALPCAFVNP